ncbi:uncharacterized protein YpiB (UPF0302 family) [Bacillus mesophilus]|uniref:IDEAL domain-containing protein n=1 Tax=Bacillus mesophilus TaxID=1808955 RepID=A0A6M0Q254_9BACI|nr:IDEAL domain-containing protein [Bacillus mesophilus]MBM7659581.1 uncharacterized protein YpiB (UPF0302 family) [Bacillus mesophilus]NEY70451.1 IDEAL domain-containing protein [Bacillus mesophilus]
MKRLKREYNIITNTQHKFFSYKLTKDQEFSLQIQASLFLDEQCFLFNKKRIDEQVNKALMDRNEERFHELCQTYEAYLKA